MSEVLCPVSARLGMSRLLMDTEERLRLCSPAFDLSVYARGRAGSRPDELAQGIRRNVIECGGVVYALPYSPWPWSARIALVAAWEGAR